VNAAAAEAQTLVLRGEHITLDALLKATGLASSGGAGKQLIADGQLWVNGEVELRRGRKLRAGDEVQLGQGGTATRVRLLAAPGTAPP
jgi:ribosome-associated protein